MRSGASTVAAKADKDDPTENQADLEEALAYLMQSATFRALWAQFQDLYLKIVVHRNAPLGHELNPDRPNEVTWDPDRGQVYEAGIASPALGLAHEIAHAVRYHTDSKGYVLDDVSEEGSMIDPNDPNHLIFYRDPSAEEERAADVEATIRVELGEPERLDYNDGTNGGILITDPTFSCFRGNPTCDTLIQNHEGPR